MRCQLVKYHGDNRATFSCPSGHKFRRAVIPLKGRGARRVGESAVLRMVSWWKSTGVNMDCPKCNNPKEMT